MSSCFENGVVNSLTPKPVFYSEFTSLSYIADSLFKQSGKKLLGKRRWKI